MTTKESAQLEMIGNSEATGYIREEVVRAAQTNAKVLVTGPTGVGKDLVARLIHQHSNRRLAPMTMLNCAGVADTLLESELFGHQRGSFTDAYRDKPGILEAATKGTVFLDEVGEMSPRMQAVLLRFLETGELQRVGADRVHAKVDVRIIAATNRDLFAEMNAGRFREDLFYRLNVVSIQVPALRERREDILPLTMHYLDHFARTHGVTRRTATPAAIELLQAHEWPGNVRQLKNVLERLTLRAPGTTLEAIDVQRDLRTTGMAARPAVTLVHDRERTTVDDLVARLSAGESFWSAVHAPFKNHDLTRAQLKEIVARGLERSCGNYRMTVEQFNMPQRDYKRFIAFLRQNNCHVSFKAFRQAPMLSPVPARLHHDPFINAVAV